MPVLGLLAGVFLGASVYFLLAEQAWRRLIGLALLGQALPLLVISAMGASAQAITIAVSLALAAFALFLAAASFLRSASREDAEQRSGKGQGE
jgi:multisubunit Na+/H+ antiporter MnhC subunit